MQVHRLTGTKPFELVLTRQPQGIMLSAQTSALPQERHAEPTPSQMKFITLTRIPNYLTRAKASLTTAQEIYRANFDKKPRGIGTPIAMGEEVYLDRPRNYAVMDAETTYSKVLRRTCGPFRVLRVFPNMVLIDYNGLKDTLSRDGISKGPKSTPVTVRTLASSKDITADPMMEELLPTLSDTVDSNRQT